MSEATTYQAVPTQNSEPAGGSETPVEQDEYNLTFGTFVNTDLPGGAYSNQVVVSAVVNPKYVTWGDLTTMQEMAYTACNTAGTGDTKQLTDACDDNTYTVAKLPNDTCWMTQNLRLSSGRTLTSADSNVTRDWSFSTNPFVNGDHSFTEPQSTTSDEASYGGYYNYCAASAGTVCSDAATQDATQDICPKGWRLPTRDGMESVTKYQDAFSLVFSGLYAYGTLYSTGSWGSWWSATAYNNNTHQYVLYYNDNRLYTSSGDGKHLGVSVRCISAS